MDGFIRFKPQINVFVGVINQEESGVVWLSGNGNVNLSSNGLYEFIPDKQITNHYFHNDRDSLTQVNKNLISSIDDRDSCLYLLTNDGLWMFDKTNKTYRRPPVNPRDSSLLFYKHWNTTSVKFLRRNLACCRVSMELILHDDINDSKAAHKKL
jgi:hypothetical protein